MSDLQKVVEIIAGCIKDYQVTPDWLLHIIANEGKCGCLFGECNCCDGAEFVTCDDWKVIAEVEHRRQLAREAEARAADALARQARERERLKEWARVLPPTHFAAEAPNA